MNTADRELKAGIQAGFSWRDWEEVSMGALWEEGRTPAWAVLEWRAFWIE